MNLEELAQQESREIAADPVMREMVQQYLAGIHARQDQLAADANLLSSEFRSRGLKPRRFSALDIVRLGFARSVGQFDPFTELRLSLARVHLGQEMFDEMFPWPQSDQIPVPVFNDAKNQTVRPPSGDIPIARDEFPRDRLQGTWLRGRTSTGSNAWTHAPTSTVDGYSYLANDFHVHFRLPSLYLPMQLSTPGFDFLGVSIAGQPGLISGTNGKVGVGFVASMADAGDWYRLKIHPKDPSRYRWNGQWKSFEQQRRTIRVLGEKPVTVSRRRSEAGLMIPALRDKGGTGREIEAAYRWAGFSYSIPMKAVAQFFDIREAKDCGSEEILKNLGLLVLTCIDDQGTTGYWLSGQSPRRSLKTDPRLIQWAEKDEDVWREIIPVSENSASHPAASGWPLANQMSLSNKNGNYIGWNFSPPFRAITLENRLKRAAGKKWDLESVVDVQSDITDERFVLAKDEMLRIASPLRDSGSVCERTFVDEIEKWDGVFRPDSIGATLATVWLRNVSLQLARVWYGEQVAKVAEPFNQWQIVRAIRGPRNAKIWKLSNGQADKDAFIRGVLAGVCRTRFESIGAHPEKYRWGNINRPLFSSLTGEVPKETLELEPGGSIFSLFSQGTDHGTALRAVMKVKNPPEYYFAAPDGTDGDPESPLSSVWSKVWAARSVLRLPSYTKQEIEAHHGK